MFANAVTPITCNAENLARNVSTDPESPLMSTRLAAAFISSSPLEAPDRFKLCLSLARVDMLVRALFSNCLLSNRISTTF